MNSSVLSVPIIVWPFSRGGGQTDEGHGTTNRWADKMNETVVENESQCRGNRSFNQRRRGGLGASNYVIDGNGGKNRNGNEAVAGHGNDTNANNVTNCLRASGGSGNKNGAINANDVIIEKGLDWTACSGLAQTGNAEEPKYIINNARECKVRASTVN